MLQKDKTPKLFRNTSGSIIRSKSVEQPIPTWFQEARHRERIEGTNVAGIVDDIGTDNWRRYAREKTKTVSVALVLCLNIGVDPPDVTKPTPCAKLEAWIDPSSTQAQKAIDKIAVALETQYQRWQPRARYKTAADPTVDEVKKLCCSMRRNAKDERVLFHYNGHGVPKPTDNGEIWVFNKNFTQYIPLSIYDLQTWMGHPSVYVWDCNSAGTVVSSFIRFTNDHEREWKTQFEDHRERARPPLTVHVDMTPDQQADAFGFRRPPNYRECIHLAACLEGELLPMNPEMPADLFTSALTTPIKTSVQWHIAKNGLKEQFAPNVIDTIPGKVNDRKTLLGELNWIFTAITDTIAWNMLPRDLFQKLFRQDLLVSSFMRNFLLADRIMRAYNAHPLSCPALPSAYAHPLWNAWDYTLDMCLAALQSGRVGGDSSCLAASTYAAGFCQIPSQLTTLDYAGSSFFIDQLQAFDMWLQYANEQRQQPPQQLPVVLQVLLSQAHRVRALELLARFLDLGSWAVGHALSVGIFPYVLKLLQSPTREVRPWLSFIWAKILAVDSECQVDLVKDNAFLYFIQMLNDPSLSPRAKIVPAFVTATLIENKFRPGQEALTNSNYTTICTELLADPTLSQCSMLRLWLLIGMGRLWADYDSARWQAIRLMAHSRVAEYLSDPVPEVRAAAVYALGCLIRNPSKYNEHATKVDEDISLELASKCTMDGSVLVRCQVAVALHWFVLDFEDVFGNLVIELDKQCGTVEPIVSTPQSTSTIEPDRSNSLPRRGRTNVLLKAENYLGTSSPNVKRSNSVVVSNGDGAGGSSTNLTSLDVTNLSSPRQQPPPDPMHVRIRAHIRQLESRIVLKAHSKIWLSFLGLALDPVTDVAQLATVVVEHVHRIATVISAKIRERDEKLRVVDVGQSRLLLRSIDVATSPSTRPTFEIGSPSSTLIIEPTNQHAKHARSTSDEIGTTSMVLSSRPVLEIGTNRIYEPKRQIFDRGPNQYHNGTGKVSASSNSQDQNNEPAMKRALIESDVVGWCSKRFTEPLLDVVQGHHADDRIDDQLATSASPTDWARHMADALDQHAIGELYKLRHQSARMDTQKFVVNCATNRPICAMALSHLRPYLYASDGRSITVWDWQSAGAHVAQQFCNNDTNPLVYLTDINPMTTELLLTATNVGVVRIWHTGLIDAIADGDRSSVKLITAANLLHDQNQYRFLDTPTTVYHWEQRRGLLLLSGDIHGVRLWDVHAEQRARDDLPLPTTRCVVTTISADVTDSRLVCVGCRDGAVHVYDDRLPSASTITMSLRDLQSSVVNVCVLPTGRVIACAVDGQLRIWDPRMYQEPVVQLNVLSNPAQSLTSMAVQTHGQLIACATSSPSIKVLDVDGHLVTSIRYHDGIMGTRLATLNALAFHPSRVSLAAATNDCYLTVYGMSG